MNNRFIGAAKNQARSKRKMNILISIVILVELIMVFTVTSFAWVETVSSIKIATRNADNNEDPLVVDTYHFTEATIGEGKGTIDLGAYFKQAGDMHFAPTSSADGENMYFPKVTSAGTAYVSSDAQCFRKGDSSDKNTAYMSISFKLRADVNADFFFTQVPTFSYQGTNMRVSVTAYTEGMSKGDLYDNSGKPQYTNIYAMSDSAANATAVGSTSGSAVSTSYEAFGDHIKGKGSTAKLFSVAADETKIVTINVWLQGAAINNNLPQEITISNLGIISDLTPRHVTLIPTDRWDTGGTAYYYAWCWMGNSSIPSRLYKLSLDDNEHYSFDYNGKYDNTLFFKSEDDTLTTDNMSSHWNSTTIKFKSVDTAIPTSPVDPTYVITELRGGDADDDLGGSKKSKGVWASPDIVTIKTAYVTGQTTWGTLTSSSYYDTSVTSSQQVEANNSSNANAKHHDTIHALPGKKVRLTAAAANSNYAFVGWYDNAAGTGTALSTSATYDFNASSEAPKEVTYYAKFKEVRKLTIVKYLDGVATNTTTAKDVGSITIGTNTSANDDVTSYSQTFDKGTSVTFSATPSTGYNLTGIYTTATGGNSVSSVTLDDNTTYYARFTTNSYEVKTRPCYTNTTGGTSFTIANTGGTVKTGTATATSGSTTTSSQEVKYKTKVTLKATPASGYEFVGWYTGQSSGTLISSDAEYEYTMNTTSAVTIYGRFMKMHSTSIYVAPRTSWGDNYYVRLYQGSGTNVVDSNNGFVQATYDSNTGYYKATFTTSKTGSFYALIAKDNNHTGKVPSEGGYTGTLGTSYVFKHDQSGTALTQYSAQRCIWFIIGDNVSWIKDNINSYGDYMNIWANNTDNKMYKVNDNAYAFEFTSVSGTIYFQQHYSGTGYRNQWTATISSTKSQYTASTYNSGSWTN